MLVHVTGALVVGGAVTGATLFGLAIVLLSLPHLARRCRGVAPIRVAKSERTEDATRLAGAQADVDDGVDERAIYKL